MAPERHEQTDLTPHVRRPKRTKATYYIVKRGTQFLRFGSYSQASSNNRPHPRGCFTRKKDAEARAREDCYINGNCVKACELSVAAVTIEWS